MADFILLMHDDAPSRTSDDDWANYFKILRASGAFEGGSAIGDGVCARKDGASRPIAKHITGYIRVTARDLADAKRFLKGNPVYEAGGTIEIRELPRD
jgi:hypothetical protein